MRNYRTLGRDSHLICNLQQPAVARTRMYWQVTRGRVLIFTRRLRSYTAVEPIPFLALKQGNPRMVPRQMPKRHTNTELAFAHTHSTTLWHAIKAARDPPNPSIQTPNVCAIGLNFTASHFVLAFVVPRSNTAVRYQPPDCRGY